MMAGPAGLRIRGVLTDLAKRVGCRAGEHVPWVTGDVGRRVAGLKKSR
jgi:hypothetical protein